MSRNEPRVKWAGIAEKEEQLQSQRERIGEDMVKTTKKATMQLKNDEGRSSRSRRV